MRHKNTEKFTEIVRFVEDFYRDNDRTPSIRQIAGALGMSSSNVHRYLVTMADEGIIDYDGDHLKTERMRKTMDDFTTAGILGQIPCGPLQMEEAEIDEFVQLPTSIFGRGDLYILEADGDSMTGAGIDDGDLVVIRQQEEANPGDIIVAYVPDMGSTLKTLKYKNRKPVLHPENPEYEDIHVKYLQIQGVVVKVIKDPKIT